MLACAMPKTQTSDTLETSAARPEHLNRQVPEEARLEAGSAPRSEPMPQIS